MKRHKGSNNVCLVGLISEISKAVCELNRDVKVLNRFHDQVKNVASVMSYIADVFNLGITQVI